MLDYMNNSEKWFYESGRFEDIVSDSDDEDNFGLQHISEPQSKRHQSGQESENDLDVWVEKFRKYRKHVRKTGFSLNFDDIEDYSTKSLKFLYQYRHVDKEFAFMCIRLVAGLPTSQLSESVYSFCQNQLFVNMNADTLSYRVKVNGNKPYFKYLDK